MKNILSPHRSLRRYLVLALISVSFTACPEPTRAPPLDVDGGSDLGEAGLEVGGDEAGVEAGVEAGDEAGSPAGVEAGDEAGAEAGDPAGVEAGEPAGVEAGEEAGDEAGDPAGVEAGEEAGDEAGDPAGVEAGMTLLPCESPLTVERERFTALSFSLLTLRVTGGSGELTFELVDAPSGGVINADTGAYLAGDISGVIDTIRVSDRECIGEVTFEVEVVPAMVIKPARPRVPRGRSMTFDVEEGSGSYEFSWLDNASGGDLEASGDYFAGDALGQDRIQVVDLETGEVQLILIEVVERVSVEVEPRLAWIPLNSTFSFSASGGSGEFEFEWVEARLGQESPLLTPENQTVEVTATTTGRGTLIARDRFLGIETRATVSLVGSLQYEGIRSGKDHRESRLSPWGDYDGDGIDELIFASGQIDLGSAEAGALYIYSSATGEVLQRITRDERSGRFGRQVAVGDWSGDGVPDLAVSAYLGDRGTATDIGITYLYQGIGDGTVIEEPSFTLYGTRTSGQAGHGLALCDFNGDGSLDLAVGEWLAEVPGRGVNNQGVVSVYLGTPDGFASEPDQIIAGKALETNEAGESVWSDASELRIGYYLGAGDFDGDGLCDLAASSYTARSILDRPNTGEVHIFKGFDTFGSPPVIGPDGGLSADPVVAIAPQVNPHPGDQLGRRLLVTDRDSDGRAELIVSQPFGDVNLNDSGAVYLYQWEMLPETPATSYLGLEGAAEVLRGTSASEAFGCSLAVGDFDGDSNLDLAVGAYNGELPGNPGNAGTLSVFLYDDTLGAYEAEPSHVMSGLFGNERLGDSVAILGVNQVASFAPDNDELGPNVGALYRGELIEQVNPETMEMERVFEHTELIFEAEVGYGRFGTSIDLADLNRDGAIDVLAGAPYSVTESERSVRAGSAHYYALDDVDVSLTAAPQPLVGFRGHGGYDQLGSGVSFIGDFDGDGREDIAVSALSDERPNTFGNQDIIDGTCRATQNNAGAVYILRGTANGFESEPSFVIFGERTNDNLEELSGRVDLNNDGRDDIIIGARSSDPVIDGSSTRDAGRGWAVLGRPAPAAGERTIICEPDAELLGERVSSRLGTSVLGVRDLNNDGCDEALFGEPDLRVNNANRQGVVHILFGWGAGCFSEPRVLSITLNGNAEARFGSSLAAADFDLDGTPDLVVGAYNANASGERRGAVWVIRNSALDTLAPLRLDQARVYHDLSGSIGDEASWKLGGELNQSRFGWAVAATSEYIFVGAPWMGVGDRAGRGYLYKMGPSGVERLHGIFEGENARGDGNLGFEVKLVRNDSGASDRAWIGIGSLWGRGNATQSGSVYVGEFTP